MKLEELLKTFQRAKDRLRSFEAARSSSEAIRRRPRSPEEWDWLRAKGGPAAKLGPRWEGPGPVPHYPEGDES